jgi:hypothetical protein
MEPAQKILDEAHNFPPAVTLHQDVLWLQVRVNEV